jgi:hypothetical protein
MGEPLEPFESEVRKRDADKGHSPAGITMSQSEWDRRHLLNLLDVERASHARTALAAAFGRDTLDAERARHAALVEAAEAVCDRWERHQFVDLYEMRRLRAALIEEARK